MVSVIASGVLRGTEPPADLTGKGVVTGVSFIISFFKCFAFVFAVHIFYLLKNAMPFGRLGV